MKLVVSLLISYWRTLTSLGFALSLTIVAISAGQTYSFWQNEKKSSDAATNQISRFPTAGRTIRIVSSRGTPGNEVTVGVELDSQGDEVATSFTINFDPTVLNTPLLTLGSDVPLGTILTVNSNQAGSGRVGLLLDSSSSFAFSPPARQALRVKFNVAVNAPQGLTTISFGNSPTMQSVSSPNAELLPASYQEGTVLIEAAAPFVSVGGRVTTPTGLGLRNAAVSIIDSNNVRRTATTSSFGLYTFSNVKSGLTYTITVSSKRYRFAAKIVSVSNDISNLNFVGLE